MKRKIKKLILLSFLILAIPNLSNAKDTIKLITHNPVHNKGLAKDCGTEICASLLKLIDGANKTIDFAIYGLRYELLEKNIIFQALINAGKRGIKVRGVTDKSLRGKNYYTDNNLVGKNLKFVHDDYKNDPDSGIMHHKFFIVDKKYVWTGSVNISDGGVGGHDANVVAYINSPYLAKYYTTEFEQMFTDGNYRKRKKKLKKKDILFFLDETKVLLFFSPHGYAVTEGILPLIKQAEKTIDIWMFLLTHNKISKALVDAKERGIKVRLILDTAQTKDSYSKHNYLRKKGVDVKIESWEGHMHIKAAVIDKKHIVLGSMNWTLDSEKKNDENTIVINNSSTLALQLSTMFEEMWNSNPNSWINKIINKIKFY